MSTNPYLLTLPQLLSAKKKLGTVAAHYDPNFYSMSGFEAEHLNPSQFREQLRRNFFITLTDAELGALVTMFDSDNIGKVNSMEFIREFFKMGKQERTKIDLTHKLEMEKIENHQKKQREERLKKFTELACVKVASTWTKEQEKSAFKKIAKLSVFYDDHNHELERFQEQTTFSAGELRGLLRINFLLNLSPEETAAFANYIGPEADGRINCKKFVFAFLQLGREQRERHDQKQCKLNQERMKIEQARIEDVKERFGKLVVAKVAPATEAEKKSAYEKIKKVAIAYKVDSMFSNIKQGFESASVTPTELRELLKSNFAIHLSPGELDAVVTMFDAHGTGEISSSAFLMTIGRMNGEERSRKLMQTQAKNYRLMRAEEELSKHIVDKLVRNSQTKVVWPVLPTDNNFGGEDGGANSDNEFNPSGLVPGSCLDSSSPSNSNSNSRASSSKGKKGGQLEPLKLKASSQKSRTTSAASADEFGSGNEDGFGFEDSVGTTLTCSMRPEKKKKRKQTTQEIIAPILQFSHSKGKKTPMSFTELFPMASKSTKDFLKEIEEKEREIKNMKFEKPSRVKLASLPQKSVELSESTFAVASGEKVDEN